MLWKYLRVEGHVPDFAVDPVYLFVIVVLHVRQIVLIVAVQDVCMNVARHRSRRKKRG